MSFDICIFSFSKVIILFLFLLKWVFCFRELSYFLCMFKCFDFNDTFRNLSTSFKQFPHFIFKYVLIILWEFHICIQMYFDHSHFLLKPLRIPSLCVTTPQTLCPFLRKIWKPLSSINADIVQGRLSEYVISILISKIFVTITPFHHIISLHLVLH